MAAFFVTMICAAVAIPFSVMAWAMKRSHCPECGAEVGPDADILRVLGG
jgi:hypothetical protein